MTETEREGEKRKGAGERRKIKTMKFKKETAQVPEMKGITRRDEVRIC